MKKIISCLVLLVCTTMAFAQSSLVATLNHNDSVSVYYGVSALVNAYKASTNGDVITLSSGGFNTPEAISKAITIRGAGMEVDTINNVAPTVLLGSFRVYTTSTDSVHRFVMEGICHGDIMKYGSNTLALKDAQFIKCRFKEIIYNNINEAVFMHNVKFVQCKISNSITLQGDATFVNSVVRNPGKIGSGYSFITYGDYECINCVILSSANFYNFYNSTFQNCILYSPSSSSGGKHFQNTNMLSNCIVITSYSTPFQELPVNISNIHFRELSDVFKTFKGTYSDTETFELQDSIKTKYLGIDGTEVGIYGGNFPYSPKTMLPKIKKFDVASKSTADGKLKVEIMVSAADE